MASVVVIGLPGTAEARSCEHFGYFPVRFGDFTSSVHGEAMGEKHVALELVVPRGSLPLRAIDRLQRIGLTPPIKRLEVEDQVVKVIVEAAFSQLGMSIKIDPDHAQKVDHARSPVDGVLRAVMTDVDLLQLALKLDDPCSLRQIVI